MCVRKCRKIVRASCQIIKCRENQNRTLVFPEKTWSTSLGFKPQVDLFLGWANKLTKHSGLRSKQEHKNYKPTSFQNVVT